MKVQLVFVIYFMLSYAMAQSENGGVNPQVSTLTIDEASVTTLHLSPGYATSIRLPEEVSSVVIGNPASFKAEHSENEPRLIFVKPITSQACESNALITTRSGQEINLRLISAGKSAENSRVDFMVEYKRPSSPLIAPSPASSFLIPDTELLSAKRDSPPAKASVAEKELARQQAISSPEWQGKDLQVAVGESIEHDRRTVVGFSVLNTTRDAIEILPPQIELAGKNAGKQIKAEPVAVAEFRLTRRHLDPGERADGVVVFERPKFKEASEELRLELAEAGSVDHPVVVPLEFVPANEGDVQ